MLLEAPKNIDHTPKSEPLPNPRSFRRFARQTIGDRERFGTPDGKTKRLHYFDWTASGRASRIVERYLKKNIIPLIANTHTETNKSGKTMTEEYHHAKDTIKASVGADPKKDVLLLEGSGATGPINKWQRLLGLMFEDQQEKFRQTVKNFGSELPTDVFPKAGATLPPEFKPVVFISEMEHHSNQITWESSFADVVIIGRGTDGRVDQEELKQKLEEYDDRKVKIGAFSAASNVTGIENDVEALAEIMHGPDGKRGKIFVDYAAAAPYVDINMRPDDPLKQLDAIFVAPHKLLGGPQTPGLLLFDKELYPGGRPDRSGGGTVLATSPDEGAVYYGDEKTERGEPMTVADIEGREDGGTPPFVQTIRAGKAFELKEQMNPTEMKQREQYLINTVMDAMNDIEGLTVLEADKRERLGIISFHMGALGMHHNLVVKLMNDRYGIQVRGGCSCAGTYGHRLCGVDSETSKRIIGKIKQGDESEKPGWVRVSVHPTNSDKQVRLMNLALKEIALNGKEWEKEYDVNEKTMQFTHKNEKLTEKKHIIRRTAARAAETVLAIF